MLFHRSLNPRCSNRLMAAFTCAIGICDAIRTNGLLLPGKLSVDVGPEGGNRNVKYAWITHNKSRLPISLQC